MCLFVVVSGMVRVEGQGMVARRRRGAAALVAAAALIGLVAMIAPPASAASSWKTVRTENFSGSSLPSGCGEYTGKYPGGASVWKPDDVRVAGGRLSLKLEKRKASGRSYTSGGVGCWGWAQTYGRYEVRAKVPAGKGIDSYLTLWPKKGGDGAWTGIELLAPSTETAYITNGYGATAETARVPGSYAGAFHTYVIEWAPHHLRILVDGNEVFYSTRAYTGSRWFGLVVSNGDALTGLPDGTTKLPASFLIDRVKVSSYTGVPPKAGTSPVDAAPTPVPAASPSSAATTTTPATALKQVGDQRPLAGGIWPWLLGGSLIAGSAALLLTYPSRRRR